MTHTSTEQPEALRLADALEKEHGSELLDDAADRLRRLHSRVQELEAALVKESARTANEKLRADQMTKQHAMQAKMHAQAAQAQRVQLTEDQCVGLWRFANGAFFTLASRATAFARAIERAHGITQEKQG